ncbi:MAG TPA: RDD family protein [Methanomicrobiales archaeon]|nr:RDD family protein [Methanomicrobiales archaeon]
MSMKEKEGDEIRPLEDLLAKGKITQQEFESARAKILAAKGSMPCPACGAKNPETARECFNCGGLLRGEQYVCPDCGAQLPSRDVAACPACGSKFAVQAQAPAKVYAGFWARLGASLIDGLLVGVLVLLVSSFAAFFTAVPTSSPSEAAGSFFTITLVLAAGISWAYFAGQESSAAQATLGKRAIGARVADLEGKRITLARATGRWLAKFLSAAPLCIGFVLIGFTEKKQGLHDKIAGTLVRYRGKSG